jgi:hypothetical protein
MFARGIGCPLPDTQHFQISNKSEPGFQGSDLIPNWWCFGNDRAAPHAVGSHIIISQKQVFMEGSDPPSASLTNQSVRKVLAGGFLESPGL